MEDTGKVCGVVKTGLVFETLPGTVARGWEAKTGDAVRAAEAGRDSGV